MAYVDRLGDVWRATMAMTTPSGQVQEMNLNYEITVQGAGDSRAALLAQIDTNITTFVRTYMSNTCHYYGSRLSAVRTAFPYAPVITTPNLVGLIAEHMLPSQTRPIIKLYTELVGRKYRGRLFMFTPVASQTSTNETPEPAMMSSYKSFVDSQLGGVIVGGTTWTASIWHRPHPPAPPLDPTPVTRSSSSGRWGTQRRSGDYGRLNSNPW